MLPADIGTGTTITFGTSGFSAQITNVSHDDISRESVDTTHLGTQPAGSGKLASRTSIAGDLADPGTITIEGHHDADLVPPVEGAPETVTVTFPLGTGESTPSSWAATGQMLSYSYVAPLEDKCTFTATIKLSGNITVTAAA